MIKFYSWSWRFTETSEFIVCNCHNLTGLKETLKKENMQKICAKASCEWSSFFFSSNEFFVELRLSIYLIFFPEKDIDNNYSFLNTIQRKKKKKAFSPMAQLVLCLTTYTILGHPKYPHPLDVRKMLWFFMLSPNRYDPHWATIIHGSLGLICVKDLPFFIFFFNLNASSLLTFHSFPFFIFHLRCDTVLLFYYRKWSNKLRHVQLVILGSQ